MKNESQKNNILHFADQDIWWGRAHCLSVGTDLKDEFDQVHVASTGEFLGRKLAENGIQHHRILDVDSNSQLLSSRFLLVFPRSSKENEITIVHTHHRMAAFYIRLLQMRQSKIGSMSIHSPYVFAR